MAALGSHLVMAQAPRRQRSALAQPVGKVLAPVQTPADSPSCDRLLTAGRRRQQLPHPAGNGGSTGSRTAPIGAPFAEGVLRRYFRIGMCLPRSPAPGRQRAAHRAETDTAAELLAPGTPCRHKSGTSYWCLPTLPALTTFSESLWLGLSQKPSPGASGDPGSSFIPET